MPKNNTKSPNKAPGRSQRTQSLTMEERQAASYRRLQLIQEALRTSCTTPPSGLPTISASSLTSPTFTSTPCLLRYRSQATQTSPSEAWNTADVISPTVVDVSSEDEYHGGALAAATGDNLDGNNAFDNKSIHGGLTPAKDPRRVVILDSDEESYPVAGSPGQQSQESLSPPPPGQCPHPRTPSPGPSWEHVPMPGAFPATQYEMDWNSSPVQPVEEIKDEDIFYMYYSD